LERESLDYYRARARDEREAALNASGEQARTAHEQMADAYEQLVELAELEEVGDLPPGKVTSMSDALHHREESEYGGHAPRPGPRPRSR
jgi:hypothetical protein